MKRETNRHILKYQYFEQTQKREKKENTLNINLDLIF